MRRVHGVEMWATHVPWMDVVELRAIEIAAVQSHAVSVENGRIVWEVREQEGSVVPVFLSLYKTEAAGLSAALSETMPPENATLDALKDAREVRDRLLGLVESGWSK